MRPQRSYSWMKAWCVRLVAAAMVVAVSGAASAQDIDLNPVKGAAPDIKQEEPNAKTVTELETPKAEVQAGEEVAEGEAEPSAEDGEAAAPDVDKKKAKKDKKEKKERKSRKKKKKDDA